ncbi:MAG: NfeD family protein [Candidatus Aminicenantes bacterium]|nr:MAG: NfeD family protein [Candidatus Aminicenantes bacterium]
MEFKIWWIWMAVAALFVVGEIFTQGFFLLWFGIGAAVAGILAILGLGVGWQLGAFVVVSGVLFVVSRRFAEKISKEQPQGIGADRFVGLEGTVLEEIDNVKNTGRVRVQKDEWRADSETGELIPEGEQIVVTRLDGTHMVVKIKREEE